MKPSPSCRVSWEIDSRSAGQEMMCLVWNQKVDHSLQNNRPSVPVLIGQVPFTRSRPQCAFGFHERQGGSSTNWSPVSIVRRGSLHGLSCVIIKFVCLWSASLCRFVLRGVTETFRLFWGSVVTIPTKDMPCNKARGSELTVVVCGFYWPTCYPRLASAFRKIVVDKRVMDASWLDP